ncbi:MAG: MBL fold metallo-hydrolase [Verrucomicrobiota bacterium]|jgi:glyoxylase-like metal-dependent hydrolase (beta-lactamase superfamily II)|nr:MBL fold metallo-hydrolase [Verrucomicrobiota bacterium]
MMHIETHEVGFIEENCYFVIQPDTRQAVVIDPGADGARLLRHLKEQQATAAAFLITHGHTDHIGALAELSAAWPDAPIHIHRADAAWGFSPQNCIPGISPVPPKPRRALSFVQDGDTLDLIGGTWSCIGTPGHTPGGICWFLQEENALFTGDTLFRGSAGRTDLPGGDSRILLSSLKTLADRSGNPTLYPGHGAPTTLDHEKAHNYFLQF